MSEKTTFIKATAILSVGIIDEPDGLATLIPFYMAELYDHTGKVKRVFCNYTFGKRGADEKPEYETDLGRMKELLFCCIPGQNVVFGIMSDSYEFTKSRMLEALWLAPNDSKILFVYQRNVGDDTVFFDALNIKTGDTLSVEDPLTLEEVGLTVCEPFVAITREQLASAPRYVLKPPKLPKRRRRGH